MAGRTFAIGDIHGEMAELETLLAMLPELDASDTLVFLGDYVDRGPDSAQVVELLRTGLPARTPARVTCLRGNHEDAWVRIASEGWVEFVLPRGNGCLETLRSFQGRPPPDKKEGPHRDDMEALFTGNFLPAEVVQWFRQLPYWYEDEHAIYVHAGVPQEGNRWLHPSEVTQNKLLLWVRTRAFFESYTGKRIVVGHTSAGFLPQELSAFTPDDPTDLFAHEGVFGIDTGCGSGGFLTALELPGLVVYESRRGR